MALLDTSAGFMGVLSTAEMRGLGYSRQPWMAPALSPCIMSAKDFAALVFVHHLTHLYGDGGATDTAVFGNSTWVAASPEGRCVALSFDFQSLSPGVFVISNMLGICTNVLFLPDVKLGAESVRLTSCARAVHTLQWQSVVAEHVLAEAGTAEAENDLSA
jgi:hypothetical protein